MSHADRRPWLIISKREAEAILPILRDYMHGAPLLDDKDLIRAERVIANQLAYIAGEVDTGEPNVTATIIREQRS